MGWAALTSGGKDSVLAAQIALDRGLDLRYLVTFRPENPFSYMFHASNLDAVRLIAQVSGLGYVEFPTPGIKEAELEDLERGLSGLDIGGIITGAVESEYQMRRIGAIADRLSLEVFSPLWQMDPAALLEQVAERLDAIIVVTAADGLDESFLGQRIDRSMIVRLKEAAVKHRIHLAGEGGEYETLTLNAPFYRRPIRYSGAVVQRGSGRSEIVLKGLSA
ncbi:MAG: diphthine--ammonia ligase [Methanoregulaceae archaeon]|nr:diphthine--ammonia ligase [Methanoregulaceae archaeon]